MVAMTGESFSYASNNPVNYADPTGLFSVGEAWDATGGRVVKGAVSLGEAAWEQRDKIATGIAIGTCVAATLGTCAAVSAGAFLIRSQVAVERKDGWVNARRDIAIDGLITVSTFGLVSVPASHAWAASTGRHWAASAKGIFHGAPPWQEALARGVIATPDLAGLWASTWADC